MVNLQNLSKTTDKLDYFCGLEIPIGPIDILRLILKLKWMKSALGATKFSKVWSMQGGVRCGTNSIFLVTSILASFNYNYPSKMPVG